MNAGTVRSALVLVNPAASAGHGVKAVGPAVARFREHGLEVTTATGADPADALRIAREAVRCDVDALVVVGGDGMVSLALQAVTKTHVPLGIVPVGTGNDLARAFGLPLHDPLAAADVIAAGHVRRVDTGRISTADGASRYFGSVLAVGFDSLVSDRANRMKYPRGRLKYYLAMVRELAGLRARPFLITLENGQENRQSLTMISIGNTRSYGGGMLICPQADPEDGLFDLTLVAALSRSQLVGFFPTVFRGTHIRHSAVTTHRSARVRLDSVGINAYADGDYAGPLPATAEIVPRSLSVFVPK